MIQPIPKPAPTHNGTSGGSALGEIFEDALPIFVHENVLEEILDFSEQDMSREQGGFLVGGLHEDGRTYVEIRHFLPAADTRSRAASLTFTHETWSQLNKEVETRFSEEVVIGWHHTHPNFGIFLSAYDLFIHRNFFSQPWQIAMVVDPQRQEMGFFQWRQGKVADCGFFCVWDEPVK